jgi:hypothetical protein
MSSCQESGINTSLHFELDLALVASYVTLFIMRKSRAGTLSALLVGSETIRGLETQARPFDTREELCKVSSS